MALPVLIIDCQLNNVGSVVRAVEEQGHEPLLAREPKALPALSKIILPGVGSYAAGMQALKRLGWVSYLKEQQLNPKIHILGVCLGMQLLSQSGEEAGQSEGLGFIQGRTVRLQSQRAEDRVPHIGWNEIHIRKPDPILQQIQSKTDFYFVHSYHVQVTHAEQVIATTPYCGEFAAIIRHKNVWGTQFHPEKSSRHGIQLLRNFLQLEADAC